MKYPSMCTSTIVSHGRDFDAGDEHDAGRRAGGRRGFAAAHGVVIGDGHHGDAGRCRARDELRWRAPAVGRGGVSVKVDQLRRLARPGHAAHAAPALTLAERTVLTDQEIEMSPFLVGKLQEDLLAFGVLEPLAVALEELVRAALALDADQQRLGVVHAAATQLVGAGLEQPARRPFEKQERRARIELGIALHQLAIPVFEHAEMLAFFRRELLKDRAAALILGEARGTSVELQAAPLRRDRHPQRVAGEHALGGGPVNRRRLLAGPAFLADCRKSGRPTGWQKSRGPTRLFHQSFDVGAQKLGGAMALRADEMEMPGMPV